jgi:hypothetical protein
MTIPIKQHNFTTGVISASEINENFDTLYNWANGYVDSSNITDGSLVNADFASSASPETRFDECFDDFVYSGLTASATSSTQVTVIAGTAYIEGVRVVTTTSSVKTFASSEVWYCDLTSSGVYTWVAGISAPVTAHAVRLCKGVESGGSITVTDLRNRTAIGSAKKIDSVKNVTTTGVATTNTATTTASGVIVTQDISVLNGDVVAIFAHGDLSASTTSTPSVFMCVEGVAQTPLLSVALAGTATQHTSFMTAYAAAADNTALTIDLCVAAAATTTTCTMKNAICTVIRSRG